METQFYRIWVDLPLGMLGALVLLFFSLGHCGLSALPIKSQIGSTLSHIKSMLGDKASWLIIVSALAIILLLGEFIATAGDIFIGLLFYSVPNNKERVESVIPNSWLCFFYLLIACLLPPIVLSRPMVLFYDGHPYHLSGVIGFGLIFVIFYLFVLIRGRSKDGLFLTFGNLVLSVSSKSGAGDMSEVHFVLSRLFAGLYVIIICSFSFVVQVFFN